MIAEHAAAVLQLLGADDNLTVYDGKVPDGATPPYVVVWISTDGDASVALADDQSRPNIRLTVPTFATTGTGARIVSDRVHAALAGKRPAIAGRAVWKVRHDYGIPPQPDESTGRLVVDVVDVYTFSSVPD